MGANRVQMQERINQLIPLISMLSTSEIYKYCNDKLEWNISNSQINVYIRKAKKELKDNVKIARKNVIEDAYNNYCTLYKKSFMDGNWQLCLQVQNKIVDIFGMSYKDKLLMEMKKEELALRWQEVEKNKEEVIGKKEQDEMNEFK